MLWAKLHTECLITSWKSYTVLHILCKLHNICKIHGPFSCSIQKILHLTEKFTQAPPVVPVTNIRYAHGVHQAGGSNIVWPLLSMWLQNSICWTASPAPPACPRAVPSPWLKKENSSYRVWSQGLLFVSLAMFLKLFKHVSTSGTLCWPGTVVAGFQILPVVVPACNILFGGLRVRFVVPAHKICCACA